MAGRFRWGIGRGMILIAALAGLFATFGVAGGIGALIAALMLAGPVAYARPGRRLEALSWVATALPIVFTLSILATWLTAWAVLGHRPILYQDDPKFISPLVDVPFAAAALLMLLFFPSLVVCLWLGVLRVIGRLGAGSPAVRRVAVALIQPILWFAGFLYRGPFGRTFDEIGEWFMD